MHIYVQEFKTKVQGPHVMMVVVSLKNKCWIVFIELMKHIKPKGKKERKKNIMKDTYSIELQKIIKK